MPRCRRGRIAAAELGGRGSSGVGLKPLLRHRNPGCRCKYTPNRMHLASAGAPAGPQARTRSQVTPGIYDPRPEAPPPGLDPSLPPRPFLFAFRTGEKMFQLPSEPVSVASRKPTGKLSPASVGARCQKGHAPSLSQPAEAPATTVIGSAQFTKGRFPGPGCARHAPLSLVRRAPV